MISSEKNKICINISSNKKKKDKKKGLSNMPPGLACQVLTSVRCALPGLDRNRSFASHYNGCCQELIFRFPGQLTVFVRVALAYDIIILKQLYP